MQVMENDAEASQEPVCIEATVVIEQDGKEWRESQGFHFSVISKGKSAWVSNSYNSKRANLANTLIFKFCPP